MRVVGIGELFVNDNDRSCESSWKSRRYKVAIHLNAESARKSDKRIYGSATIATIGAGFCSTSNELS